MEVSLDRTITGKLTKQMLLRSVCCTTAALLFARAAVLGELYPFPAAMLCVLYKEKKLYPFCILGAFLGSLTIDFTLSGIILHTLPLILLLPLLYIIQIKNLSKPYYRMGAVAVTFAISGLCVPMFDYHTLMNLLSAGAACALIPIGDQLKSLIKNLKHRTRFTKSELMCINLVFCVLLISLPAFTIANMTLAGIFGCMYIAVAAAYFGAGAACGAGALLGLLHLLTGGSLEYAFALAAGAMMAGLLSEIKRFGVLLGFLLGNVIATLFIHRSFALIIPIGNIILGFLPVMFLPEKLGQRLLVLSGQIKGDSAFSRSLALRQRTEQVRHLRQIADVYNDIAQVFDQSSSDNGRAEKLALCTYAAGEVCSQCPGYDYCWVNRYSDTYNDFKTTASLVRHFGEISPHDVPKTLKARCSSWVQVLISMNTHNKNLVITDDTPEAQSLLMASQCRSISKLLFQLSGEYAKDAEYDFALENELADAFEKKGIEIKEVICKKSEQHGTVVSIVKKACRGAKDCTPVILGALQKITGQQFICSGKRCNSYGAECTCEFIPLPALKVSCYTARQKKEGEQICGDSYAAQSLPDGRYFAAISDGMGSGDQAARESESAMDLLAALLGGGLEMTAVYELMNTLLRLRGKEESFSTVDACVLNLDEGLCQWGKIGAAPGYFVRNNRVECIESMSLPMGILDNIQPSITQKLIKPGDLLLLVSDGVYDALCDGTKDGIRTYLQNLNTENPEEIANGLLEEALAAWKGNARDDMTAMAIKIFN